MSASPLSSPEPVPLGDTATAECVCEFTPYRDSHEESWHFLRRCAHCGGTWYSLHCPHDGNQRPCPHCEGRNTPVSSTKKHPKPPTT